MKGIVFTEFIEFAEQRFGVGTAERAVASAHLASGGAYTAVGTYDHRELVAIVVEISRSTNSPIPGLLEAFGMYLFDRFAVLYPNLFEGNDGTFEFLRRVDGYIHVEVMKLYPDAELPRFEVATNGSGELVLVYKSARAFGDLARGLMLGCAHHFGERISISTEDLSAGSGKTLRFTLKKTA